MLAAIQTGVGAVEVRDIPEPKPDSLNAVVKVKAAGICGSDLHLYHLRETPQTLPAGHEVAGEVVHLPAGYAGPIRVGDLVAIETVGLGSACGECDLCRAGQPIHCPIRPRPPAPPRWGGGFAEYIERRPAGLFKLAPGMTAEQGALVEPLAVAVHAMRFINLPSEASVVVIGAGTIGLVTVAAARALGAGPIHVVARHAHQAALATRLGATSILPEEPAALTERVAELTGGRGADVVIETVGGTGDALNLAWPIVKPRGQICVLGIFPNDATLILRQASLREVTMAFPICYSYLDGRHDYELAIEMLADGRVDLSGMVTDRFLLRDAAAAFRAAEDRSGGRVKVHLVQE